MKITDLALIFIGILLPIIIVLYINVSFTIKAQEQEMYYQKIIDIAAQDAADQMKQVENDDTNIDYGYSGLKEQKVSVNAQIAVDTFLNNLYNNFNIKGNEAAQRYLQLFIPAIAIIDYDGVQISSVETSQDRTDVEVQNGKINTADSNWSVTKHVLKPKRYYTYTYTIKKVAEDSYQRVNGISSDVANSVSYHEIEFTMDDYITHRYYVKGEDASETKTESFYITDEKFNDSLVAGLSEYEFTGYQTFKQKVIQELMGMRKDVIVNTLVKEMTYATNANNSFARSAGITYSFSFPATTQDEMYGTIENIGFMAFVQGLSIGNKYLNTKAYGLTNLELTTRYYFTIPNETDSKYKMNLYHKDTTCPEYVVSKIEKISPKYAITKQQAAAMRVSCTIADIEYIHQGFYPCPVCNP